MEINSRAVDGAFEMQLAGRLDGYWADHLSEALEESVRNGHHHIRLDMQEVVYLSSLGIRVLVTFYKKLAGIEGTFLVSNPSESVRKVLDMVGLSARLMTGSIPVEEQEAVAESQSHAFQYQDASFEIFDLSESQLSCTMLGDPDLLNGCQFSEKDCQQVDLPDTVFGIGLGALGQGYRDCRDRFGEFLSVAGAAAYLPTDSSNVPDVQIAQGSLIPHMQVLYGAICSGSPSKLARFESRQEHGAITLSTLAGAALDISGASQVGMVCVAESAGLVGATLRRPPVEGTEQDAPFMHPGIRDWLSFTTERAFPGALVVTVGIAGKPDADSLHGMLRPLGGSTQTQGHFHAAAFSYGPLQKGRIELRQTIMSIFEKEQLQGILHLIGDDRDAVGVSESELIRGACWIGPISEVTGGQA